MIGFDPTASRGLGLGHRGLDRRLLILLILARGAGCLPTALAPSTMMILFRTASLSKGTQLWGGSGRLGGRGFA